MSPRLALFKHREKTASRKQRQPVSPFTKWAETRDPRGTWPLTERAAWEPGPRGGQGWSPAPPPRLTQTQRGDRDVPGHRAALDEVGGSRPCCPLVPTPGSGPEQGRNPEKPLRPACVPPRLPPAGLSLGTWGLGARPLPAPLSGKESLLRLRTCLGPEWSLCLARLSSLAQTRNQPQPRA